MHKLFGTDGIRGIANEYPMTIETCQKLAEAIVVKFCSPREDRHSVLISRDTRLSGEMFKNAMTAILCSLGIDVRHISHSSTPELSILVPEYKASAGIMISASHNPFYYNGIKIFDEFGLKLTDVEEQELEKIMEQAPVLPRATGKSIGTCYFNDKCCLYRKRFENSLHLSKESAKNIKVVIDCANGHSSAALDGWLEEEFNFSVVTINSSPNGVNINENCGVIHPQIISEAVLHHGANLGIALDGDGDRVIVADENGRIMDGDHILALLATYEECEEVISTVMANFALEKYLSSIGVRLVRTDVGDRYISEYMQKSGAKFGAEPSGHVIIRSHALTGDGLFAGLKVLEHMLRLGKKCSELRLFEPYPTIQENVPITDRSVINEKSVQQTIRKFEKQLDGRGKLIVRHSGTEPVLRICAEGEDPAELQQLVDTLVQVILGNSQ
ncbi:MAG: phosphoglucosamine mutase [Holosporaceae bacterium]|jgi:phosphoglucosamine mutase|nr:phosphoglucosamine mutase [Holosporaceae bacterium]